MAARYQRLPRGNYFRLLNLHPGTGKHPIVCEITIARMPPWDSRAPEDQNTPYEAVSYEWGPESPQHEITLDGWPIFIRENLWQFLRHRRHPSRNLRLWIDALCIDQRNLQERSTQVQSMGEIYRAATRVLVWLGPASDDSHLVMYLMQNRTFEPGTQEAVVRWASRSYWSRTWVVQEFLIAADLVLICGSNEVQWSDVQRTYHSFENGSDRFRKDWEAFFQTPAHRLMKQRRPWVSGKAQSRLSKILIDNRYTQCFDCRDKVYAFLSLAEEDFEGWPGQAIKVDYSKDTGALFYDVMKYCSLAAQEVFAFARFLRELLQVDVLSSQSISQSSVPTGRLDDDEESSVSRGYLDMGSRTMLEAVGFNIGYVVHSDTIQAWGKAVALGEKGARSHSSECRPGRLPQPTQALESFSQQEISHSIMQLETLDLRRLCSNPQVFQDISKRSWNKASKVSKTKLGSRIGPQRFSLVVVFFLHHRDRTFSIGLASGHVNEGDSVIQFPGYEIAFTVTHNDPDDDEPQYITGRVICTEKSKQEREVWTSDILQYKAIHSEGELRHPDCTMSFSVTPKELLSLAR